MQQELSIDDSTHHELVEFSEQHSLIRRLDLQTSVLTFDVRDVIRHELEENRHRTSACEVSIPSSEIHVHSTETCTS